MEDLHTDQEEIILKVETPIIDHIEIKTTDINTLNPKEVILGEGLAEVHGEVDHMLDKHMVEANLPIKMIIAYLV